MDITHLNDDCYYAHRPEQGGIFVKRVDNNCTKNISLIHTHTHMRVLIQAHTQTHMHAYPLSLSLSLVHRQTHKYTHNHMVNHEQNEFMQSVTESDWRVYHLSRQLLSEVDLLIDGA